MVVVLGRAILVMGRVTRRIAVVMCSRLLGAVHFDRHFTRVFGKNLGVEAQKDSNKQNP